MVAKVGGHDALAGGLTGDEGVQSRIAGLLRVIGKDAKGRIVNKTISTVFKDRGDAYVQDCKMK